jgi:uncharacterized membrane protein
MSKSVVTRLFVGAVVALIVGWLVMFVTVLGALAGGVVTLGGPAVVNVDGAALAGTLPWLALGFVAMAAGAVAAVMSWVGALLNTARLEDKTWFVALLVLGLVSFGWAAMVAYVVAGPDGLTPRAAKSGIPTISGA